MGWTSPLVLGLHRRRRSPCWSSSASIETRVAEPMFQPQPVQDPRRSPPGNLASLLACLGRGGLMFILIIWLQGIYLPDPRLRLQPRPRCGPGIAMLPLTVGFLIAGPVSGWLSDRFGARPFATGGMVVAAASFLLLELLPVNFAYWQFARHPAAQRHRHGPVRLAEPGRDHEQPAARAARRRRRDERHVPELGHGAVHRHLLHADHPGPGRHRCRPRSSHGLVAQGVPRADAARIARAAAGLDHVRGAARLQPGADAARARARPSCPPATPPT